MFTTYGLSTLLTALFVIPSPCISDAVTKRIRLVNGPTSYEGRVEILYGGLWGTVCSDWWDSDDAKVACRMFGYSGHVAAFYGNGRYGQGSLLGWVREIACRGYENSLFHCPANGMGQRHNCQHAGLSCAQRTSALSFFINETVPTVYAENDVINITCRTDRGVPDPSVELVPRQDATILQNPTTWNAPLTSTLVRTFYASVTVQLTRDDDNAVYTCDVTQDGFSPQTLAITLRVQHAPIVNVPEEKTVDERTDLEVICSVQSYPESTVTWRNPKGEVVSTTSVLKLTSVSHTDSGNYTCMAENEIDDEKHTHENITTVHINHEPIVGVPQTRDGMQFENVNIECVVVSYPPATITWYNTAGSVVSTSSMLELKYLRPNEEGAYTCTARNTIGERSNSTELSISLHPRCIAPEPESVKRTCRCNKRRTKLKPPRNMTDVELKQVMEQTKKELTVDKTTLTSHIRKKISMPDNRTSSVGLGCIGILMIMMAVAFITAGDVISRVYYIKGLIESHMGAFRGQGNINSMAVQNEASNLNPRGESVAVQNEASNLNPRGQSVAVQNEASNLNPGSESVAVDNEASNLNPRGQSVAVENEASNFNPRGQSVAVQNEASTLNPGGESMAVDNEASNLNPRGQSLAVENDASNLNPGGESVAVDNEASNLNPRGQSLAVENEASNLNPGCESVAVDNEA